MESSKLMINKLIISRHLKVLESDGKRMASFKKALCQRTPPRGAGHIRMENLKDKNMEGIVDFIFRCHTERHEASTIKKVLNLPGANKKNKIIESQINEAFQSFNNMDPEKNEAVQCSKNMEIEKTEDIQCSKNMELENNEASKSNFIKVKQDVNQVFKVASITLVPACDDAPYFEQPAKKIKTDQEEDAVPGPSNNKEATASKNEEHRPVYHPPKQEPQPQVIPAQGNITNKISHKTVSKQFEVAPSHASSKEPQPQVNLIQANITSNVSHTAPSKQMEVAPSQGAFKEPQPQVSPIQGNITSKISHRASNKQFTVAPSHASSTEPSQSEKSLPSISMEKEIRNIMATHLKTLGEDGIGKCKDTLCLVEAPFAGVKIKIRHIKDKSVEEMVGVIISRHTMRYAQATVEKVLVRMDKKKIKMLIAKDICKKVSCYLSQMGSAELFLPAKATIKREKKSDQ